MARGQGTYPALPPKAIAHGATSPDPGKPYSLAFSTIENDVVEWNGVTWRIAGKGPGAKIWSVRNFFGADRMMTVNSNAGEVGAATGFGVWVQFWYGGNSNGIQMLTGRFIFGGSTGWQLFLNGDVLNAGVANGSSTYIYAPTWKMTTNDVGRMHTALLYHDGTKLRLWVDRVQSGDGTAITGYTPATANHNIGYWPGAAPLFGWSSEMTFRGTPTDAQILACFDSIRTNGDVPSAFTGAAVSRRWSLKDWIGNQVITEGQGFSATLQDTITGAATDAMGVSTVGGTLLFKETNPIYDGRKSYGVQNFIGTARLESAAGAGIRGSAAGWIALPVTFRANSGDGYLAYCADVSLVRGWGIYRYGADLFAYWGNGASNVTLSSAGVVTPLIGIPSLIHLVFRAGVGELWLNGVLLGSYTYPFVPHPTEKMVIGQRVDGWFPAYVDTVHGISGGTGSPTASEILANYQAFAKTGAVPGMSGVNHAYDFTLDIAADPNTAVPAQILDRVGTDHLTRVGGLTVGVGNGLAGFSVEHFLRSGGVSLPGSASGFSAEVLCDFGSETATTCIASAGVANYTTGGWGLFVAPGGAGSVYFSLQFNTTGGSTVVLTSTTFASGYRHVSWSYDGSVARLYIDGVLNQTSAAFTYKPPTSGALTLGAQLNGTTGVYPLLLSTVRGLSGGNFVWTAGEVSTASTSGRAAGKVQGVPSKTTLRFSLVDDVVDAGTKVPAYAKERVTGTENLVTLGASLQVSRKTDRAWGYETSPVMVGARNWNANNYFAGTQTGFAHLTNVPYWFIIVLLIHSRSFGAFQTVLSKASGDGAQGICLYGSSTWNSITYAHGAGSPINAPVYSVTDGDLNHPLVLAYQWNGGAIQAFAKRAKLGSDVSTTAFAPYTGSLMLGRNAANTTNPASDAVTVLGVQGGLGALTLGEYQAAYDGYLSEEDLVAVPNKTNRLYSVKRNAITAGGVLVGLTDQMGSGETLALNGAPTLSNIYARAS